MEHLRILNTREKKEIIETLEKQFHVKINLPYVFLMNKEEKIFLASKDIAHINFHALTINTIGLYFGKKEKDGIRLSIEGSQIIGKEAQKNVLALTQEEMMLWFKGKDIVKESTFHGYVLLKHEKDFLGCGKYKEGRILNYVEKGRRILPRSEQHLVQE